MNDDDKIPDLNSTRLDYDPETERPYTAEDYHDDMKNIMEGRVNPFHPFTAIGLPKPRMDVSGVTFLLAIPVFAFMIFIMDPFYGWKRWRFIGIVSSLIVTAVMFVLLVFTGVVFNLAEDGTAVHVMETIGTAGLAGTLIFIWPRTSVILLALAIVLSILSAILN